RILSRSPMGTPFPSGPQKTPKPANPKVHRLWLEEHMAASVTSSRGGAREKTRTLRPSAVPSWRVGTLTRARGEKSPHTTAAQASPRTTEARDAPSCRRADAAAVVLRGNRRGGRRRHRRDRDRRHSGAEQWRRQQQIRLRGRGRALQPPTRDPQDE